MNSSQAVHSRLHGSSTNHSFSDPIHHVEVNVSNLEKSSKFYEGFLSWLGYTRVLEEKGIVGWRKSRTRIFLVQCAAKYRSNGFHRKRIGLNHIAFQAPTRQTVDEFYKAYLLTNKIPILYGGTKEWPDYEGGYYAVYWEDPDRIKLELVYTPL